jgi:hypothetical protein
MGARWNQVPGSVIATDRPPSMAETVRCPVDDHERPTGSDRVVCIVLVGFVLAVMVTFWAPTLIHGLMTDELLSVWVSSNGLGDAVSRAQAYQGNSPLYFVLLWAWRAVAGSSELALRLPSVLCLVGAAWHLAKMAAELDGRRWLPGLVAVLVLVTDPEATLAATTARPYALLLLAVVLSTRALLHFLHGGTWRAGLVWVLAAATALLMSPFASLALVAHVTVMVDAARGRRITPAGSPIPQVERSIWLRRLPALGALGAIAVLPLGPQVVALAGRRDEIVTAAVPDVAVLVTALIPLALVASLAVGIAAGGWRGGWAASDPVLRMICAWAFGPIISTWVISNVTGTSIWVERYRIAAVPGIALLVALAIGRIDRSRGRAIACGALVVLLLWSASDVVGLNRHGWREAVDWARHETAGEVVTIAIDSDLVELQNLELVDDPDWRAYLSGPIGHYGLPGEIIVLPKGAGDDVRVHQQTTVESLTRGGNTVVLISRVLFRGPPDHLGAFRAAMTARDWTETAGPIVGPHQAVVFRRGS